MSTAGQTQPAPAMATAAARGASLRHALHAEWTKLRTVSGPAWLLLGVAALTHAGTAPSAPPPPRRSGPRTARRT